MRPRPEWTLLGLAALALVAGCGGDQPGNEGVTAEESRQLNETAEMLDTSPDSLIADENLEIGNGEIPAANATANAN
ncbi:hypothetical protein [Allosphingosinicella humi]